MRTLVIVPLLSLLAAATTLPVLGQEALFNNIARTSESADPSGPVPDHQTTPGPEDRGHGPTLPEGEEGGSNAAIGDALHNLYTWVSLAGLVIVLLIAVNN